MGSLGKYLCGAYANDSILLLTYIPYNSIFVNNYPRFYYIEF